jgi:hypothetical protein
VAFTDPDDPSGDAVTGEVAPAALWNTFVRDNMKAAARQWHGVHTVGTGGGFGERWYAAAHLRDPALSTMAGVVGTLHTLPWVAPRGGTLDRIMFEVTTGGAAGSVARVGLYRATSDSDPYPGALVVDGGEFVTTSTGFKTATISTTITAATLYWSVLLVGVNQPTVRAYTLAQPMLGGTAIDPIQESGFRRTQTYGALPATFPAGPPTSYVGSVPSILIRWSA